MAAGLSALAPAKVIWKLADSDLVHVSNSSLTVGDNVKIVKWAPQNNVLGHPQVKAFFTQGGTNSFNEVGCCSMPAAASCFCSTANHSQRDRQCETKTWVPGNDTLQMNSLREAHNSFNEMGCCIMILALHLHLTCCPLDVACAHVSISVAYKHYLAGILLSWQVQLCLGNMCTIPGHVQLFGSEPRSASHLVLLKTCKRWQPPFGGDETPFCVDPEPTEKPHGVDKRLCPDQSLCYAHCIHTEAYMACPLYL